MARIALDHEVRAVAGQLGVPLRVDPTTLIVEKCVQKVSSWAAELGPPSTPQELLEIVCEKLRLRFEIVESDANLKKVRESYLAQRELAFVDLDREFNATTDAVVIRLQHQAEWSNVRYVAVIDGRGAKQSRVWFSQWHEIAHLLAEPQTKFVFRRTQAFKREPVERLMDQIAGALAFYEPLFLPALRQADIDLTRPTLRDLATFASSTCSHASLQATLMAALRHITAPAILIEAKPALKTSERGAGGGVRRARPQPVLRAVSTGHNTAAQRARFFVHRNMRVPKESVIAKVFHGHGELEFKPHKECLSWWVSDGDSLPRQPVVVEAMSAGDQRVLALYVPQST